MNALDEHRHGFALGLVSQVFAAVSVKIPRDNVANRDLVAAEQLDHGVVAGIDLDDEEAIAWVDEHDCSVHGDTSHAEISCFVNEQPCKKGLFVGDYIKHRRRGQVEGVTA